VAISISAVNADIRLLLGGLPTSTLSDEILDLFIQQNITKYGDDDANLCIVTYQSLLAALQYLDRRSMQGSAVTGASGDLKRRTEKLGAREISVEYETGSDGGKAASWAVLYDDFLRNPQYVCISLKPTTVSSTVIIGGVSQKEYDRVKNNTDSRNGMSMIPSCRTRTSRRGY
jgi:hypothetical protein